MPWAPRRPCRAPLCKALTYSSYCPKHAARYAQQYRKPDTRPGNGPARQRGGGNSPHWRALRATVLSRDPVCRGCHSAPSTVADHILAIADGGEDELRNLQGLCCKCHGRKIAREVRERRSSAK